MRLRVSGGLTGRVEPTRVTIFALGAVRAHVTERAPGDAALFALERSDARALLGVGFQLDELGGSQGVVVPVAAVIVARRAARGRGCAAFALRLSVDAIEVEAGGADSLEVVLVAHRRDLLEKRLTKNDIPSAYSMSRGGTSDRRTKGKKAPPWPGRWDAA